VLENLRGEETVLEVGRIEADRIHTTKGTINERRWARGGEGYKQKITQVGGKAPLGTKFREKHS